MSKVMYRVSKVLTRRAGVRKAAIEKATEKCVWVNGKRYLKNSDTYTFLDTFEKAQAHGVAYLTQQLHRDQSQVQQTLKALNEVADLEEYEVKELD
jgi:hypothetical protein